LTAKVGQEKVKGFSPRPADYIADAKDNQGSPFPWNMPMGKCSQWLIQNIKGKKEGSQ
jgi:hypothetical protein